jgi:hypothetical protein
MPPSLGNAGLKANFDVGLSGSGNARLYGLAVPLSIRKQRPRFSRVEVGASKKSKASWSRAKGE